MEYLFILQGNPIYRFRHFIRLLTNKDEFNWV